MPFNCSDISWIKKTTSEQIFLIGLNSEIDFSVFVFGQVCFDCVD